MRRFAFWTGRNDPAHLIRNALDHGLEARDERLARGKFDVVGGDVRGQRDAGGRGQGVDGDGVATGRAGVAGGAAGEAEPDVSVSFPIGVDLRLDGFGDAVDDAEQPGLGGIGAESVFMDIQDGISIHIRFAGPLIGGTGGGLDGHEVVKAVGDDWSSGNFDVIDIKGFVDERGGHGADDAAPNKTFLNQA